MIDTHAHYTDTRYKNELDAVFKQCKEAGIESIVNVGYDMPSSRESIQLAEKYPFLYAVVGVHPHDAKTMTDAHLIELEKMLSHPKVVALGETGLDYHYDNSPREVQKHWFREHLRLAKKMNVPFVIHDREAHGDCLDIIKEENATHGIFHSYSGSSEMAKLLLRDGFYLSISGPVTFKNARKLQEVVKDIPLDRLLLETDCPYLTPEPFRGKRNDSSLLLHIAQKIADIKEIAVEEVITTTTQNAKQVFKLIK